MLAKNVPEKTKQKMCCPVSRGWGGTDEPNLKSASFSTRQAGGQEVVHHQHLLIQRQGTGPLSYSGYNHAHLHTKSKNKVFLVTYGNLQSAMSLGCMQKSTVRAIFKH